MFQPQRLADNIKQLRLARGITQTELAARLHISPQSVSKWECSLTVPDIENLCMIAQILETSVDTLLGTQSPSGKAMIGVDGGGSKTEFVLFTEDGTILDRLVLGACNPNAIGIPESTALLKKGIDTLRQTRSDICGIYVGSSGFLTGGNGKTVKAALEKAYPHVKIECRTDIMNVIASGTDEQSCVAVICGTGSIVYAMEQGKLTKLTGWGYLLSTNGSGYDIGRDALRAALADTEGFGEKTRITQLVQTRLGAPAAECVREVYLHDQSYIASFTPLVFDAYGQGDAVAARILTENAAALAEVINHAAKNYRCGGSVILSGGLLTGNKTFAAMVTKRLDPALSVRIPQIPQVLGACRLCGKMCGVDIRKFDQKLISQYYERG